MQYIQHAPKKKHAPKLSACTHALHTLGQSFMCVRVCAGMADTAYWVDVADRVYRILYCIPNAVQYTVQCTIRAFHEVPHQYTLTLG